MFLSEDLESDKLYADNIVYSICRHNDEREDNLVCVGQSISVSVRQYRGIALLATSWGASFTEDILLQFLDGTEEIISFGISDFYSDVPMFGETIACCLRAAAGFHGEMAVCLFEFVGTITHQVQCSLTQSPTEIKACAVKRSCSHLPANKNMIEYDEKAVFLCFSVIMCIRFA